MESSSDINFMSMEGLPFEDQAKLQSILFGPEEKQDMSIAGDNGLSEERRHVFNVHAQVFVPRTCQPATPDVSHVPNHPYGMHANIQMSDGRNILTNNAPLNSNMHMFNNMHHDHLQPEYLQLMAPQIAMNQRLHHQQQQQQQVLQQTHMHHNHANHMPQQHRAQIQLQQQQQPTAAHVLPNHHLHHDTHFQKTYNNYTPRNYNSSSGGIGTQNCRQEVPPRYQRKNYDRAAVGDPDGRGASRYHNKRVTVLQNPNSRRQQGGDSRLGPRFYRHTNGDYRDQWRDGYRPEYRRDYARKIDEDINSNMLKLQNGLEPKFEAGSAPSDVSDDERIVLNLNSGAMSPSSVKWPSEMSSTGSPVSRSLSPASSHASGVTSPPQAHATEHSNNQQNSESSASVKSEFAIEERPKVTSTNDNMNDKSAAKETLNCPENDSKGTNSGFSVDLRGGVRTDYVDDKWTQDFTSSDPNDEWSSIAPETPWLSGFVNDDQQLQDRIAESTPPVGVRVSSEVKGTEAEGWNSATHESRRSEESWRKDNDSRFKNKAADVLNVSDGVNLGSSHSKDGTESIFKSNDGMIIWKVEESPRSELSIEDSAKPLESGGSANKGHKTTNTGLTAPKQKQGYKTDNSPCADTSSLPNADTEQQMTKNNDPLGGSKVSMPVSNSAGPNGASLPQSTTKPGSQHKMPNTSTAGPEPKPQPPPGPPISQPPKAPQKSWAALVRHNLPADSQPALVISDQAPSATSKPTVSLKVETKDDDDVSDPGSDKLIRKLREYVSSTPLLHRPPSVHPRGLINRANWCYVNATLQALLACPPFYNMFRNMPRMKMKERGQSCTPVMDSIVEFVQEFNFMKPYSRSKKQDPPNIQSGEPFAPDYVYSMLMKLKSTDAFKQGRQEDAEEFLTCVLNHIHEELVAVMGNDTSTSGDPNGAKSDDMHGEEASDDWEQVGRKKKAVITRSNEMARSLVTDIFCGQIRSVLRSSGARESATLEPFFTLPLDIQHEKIGSVRDALAGLVSRESILGFTCSKTKEEVEATRCAMFEVLPPVLILHLKCFIYDTNGGCQKLNKEIEYTVDLEICKDIISPTARAKMRDHQRSYKLFAVVYHRGKTLQGGHYTTDVYHSGINGWIRIDDHNISVVPVTHVLRYEQHYMPYLLYYRRHDSLAQDRGAAKS